MLHRGQCFYFTLCYYAVSWLWVIRHQSGAMLVLLKGEFSDDTDTIQFTLQQDDSSPVYVCQLVRQRCSADDAADDGFTYRLYVDHAPIMEHAVDAALRVGLPQDLHTTATAVAAGPPTYYETVEHDQLPPYDA